MAIGRTHSSAVSSARNYEEREAMSLIFSGYSSPIFRANNCPWGKLPLFSSDGALVALVMIPSGDLTDEDDEEMKMMMIRKMKKMQVLEIEKTPPPMLGNEK